MSGTRVLLPQYFVGFAVKIRDFTEMGTGSMPYAHTRSYAESGFTIKGIQ